MVKLEKVKDKGKRIKLLISMIVILSVLVLISVLYLFIDVPESSTLGSEDRITEESSASGFFGDLFGFIGGLFTGSSQDGDGVVVDGGGVVGGDGVGGDDAIAEGVAGADGIDVGAGNNVADGAAGVGEWNRDVVQGDSCSEAIECLRDYSDNVCQGDTLIGLKACCKNDVCDQCSYQYDCNYGCGSRPDLGPGAIFCCGNGVTSDQCDDNNIPGGGVNPGGGGVNPGGGAGGGAGDGDNDNDGTDDGDNLPNGDILDGLPCSDDDDSFCRILNHCEGDNFIEFCCDSITNTCRNNCVPGGIAYCSYGCGERSVGDDIRIMCCRDGEKASGECV